MLHNKFIWALIKHLQKDHAQSPEAASATVEWLDNKLKAQRRAK